MQIRGMSIDEYLGKVKAFHGHLAPGMVCGGFMVELAYRSLPEDALFDAIAETRACLPDAIQVLTPCTIGNGWLRIVDTGRFAIALYDKYTGEGVRVSLDPDRLAAWPEALIWAMKLKPKKEQNKKRLFEEIIEAGPKLYKIEPVFVDRHKFAKKGKIFTCDACRESFRDSESGICPACKGDVPFTKLKNNDSSLRAVPVDDAVGKAALHDMTRIKVGFFKGPAIIKGDVLKASDIDVLKSMGKENVYVESNLSFDGELVHENDAALAFAELMAGEGILFDPIPKEGKIDFKASVDGVFYVNREQLYRFNRCKGVMCATRKGYAPVIAGMTLAGTRAIPLYLKKSEFEAAKGVLSSGPLFSVIPYILNRIGMIITGTEVAEGKISDGFTPILNACAEKYGLTVTGRAICPDDRKAISKAVEDMMKKGSEIIVVTGGLSVDPDDVTRAALQDAGIVDEIYGAPVLPGAMTLIGRIGNTRIIGVPAGAIFNDRTAFGMLFPRIMADITITRADIAELAEGGFLDAGCRKT